MVNFCFSRGIIRANYASLMNTVVSESDPRYEDQSIVMGAELRAEAHATEEARDAKLGAASKYIEYVPASPEEVEAAEYPLGRMAIGPAIDEPGFDVVAPVVTAAALDLWLDRGANEPYVSVVIARKEYVVRYPGGLDSAPMVGWLPLFEQEDSDQHKVEIETASWLRGFVAGHFNAIVA